MAYNQLDGVVTTLEQSYSKAPALPQNAREFIVNVIPWLSLIFGLLTILASLSAFGLTAVSSPLLTVGGVGLPAQLMLAAVLGLIQGILMVVAFSPLRKRQQRGWVLLFWTEVLSVVASVVSLSVSSIVVGLVVALIIFYFLFQIKPYYK